MRQWNGTLFYSMRNSSCILQEAGDSFRIKRSLFYYIMSRKCLIKMRGEACTPACMMNFSSFEKE